VARPVILGIVGDSGSGKTTITRGLVRALGGLLDLTHFSTDDYHRFERRQRMELGLTPLDPECNHLDILTQDLAHLRAGRPVLKPTYRHVDGTLGAPVYLDPGEFVVAEGLLAFHTPELRDSFDVRVYLAPSEDLRRRWKVARDSSRRGYSTDDVLDELERREPDAERFIRPQRHWADIVISFLPGESEDQEKLDAHVYLRDTLPHPDLSDVVSDGGGVVMVEREGGLELRIPGTIDPAHAEEVDEAFWRRMHFASHLRPERVGEFTVGTDLHRSDSLGLVQLLILYHLVTARAVVSLGGKSARSGVELEAELPAPAEQR
jgi:phosphoribulokinase